MAAKVINLREASDKIQLKAAKEKEAEVIRRILIAAGRLGW